jgi:hypothetical protein
MYLDDLLICSFIFGRRFLIRVLVSAFFSGDFGLA